MILTFFSRAEEGLLKSLTLDCITCIHSILVGLIGKQDSQFYVHHHCSIVCIGVDIVKINSHYKF